MKEKGIVHRNAMHEVVQTIYEMGVKGRMETTRTDEMERDAQEGKVKVCVTA